MESAQRDALIARAQEGDVRAFETLIADRLPVIRRFARAFAASEADADDLAQEALIKVYKSLRLFRYQSAFSSWLYSIVRNVFLDFAKGRAGQARAREAPLPARALQAPDERALADDLLAQEEERRRLWTALRAVPVEFRTALVLFDIEGHSYDEVAAIESVAVGTVKSRLSRGRTYLKNLLELHAEEEGDPAAGTPAGSTSSYLRRSGP